jgi:hypothetical protein
VGEILDRGGYYTALGVERALPNIRYHTPETRRPVTHLTERSQAMSKGPLITYLNDHLAGSVAALELLDHLAGVAATSEAQQFFVTLRREVTDDQKALEELLRRLGGTESGLRKAGAWLTEKLGEMKLRLDAVSGGALHELEALEALGLGIQGKSTLWLTLEAVGDQVAEVREMDLAHLQRRARDQHSRVESRRLTAARAAFDKSPGGTART